MAISCRCTISYPQLWEAKARKPLPGQAQPKPKYSALFLIKPEDMESPEYLTMVEACKAAAVEKWGAAAAGMQAEGAIDLPLKRDISTKGYPAEFARYFNAEANLDYPPAVLNRAALPITDKREIYAGAVVRILWNIYAYGGPGTQIKPGMRFGLISVQKLAEGPKLAPGVDTTMPAVADSEPAGAAVDPWA